MTSSREAWNVAEVGGDRGGRGLLGIVALTERLVVRW